MQLCVTLLCNIIHKLPLTYNSFMADHPNVHCPKFSKTTSDIERGFAMQAKQDLREVELKEFVHSP